jgi:hypothetical protein
LLLDRQAVIDCVVRLGAGLDAQDWLAVRATLADELDTDYRSFRGTPSARLTAADFVRLRQEGLAGLRTQHLSLGHLVTVAGPTARCRCDFVIRRWPADAADPRFFHTYGYYEYGLVRGPTGWRITAIRQVAVRSEGSPELHGAHRAPGAGAP